MAEKALPMIPRKHVKPNGRVDLWDLEIENGPAKIELTGILAREALSRAPDRFKLDLPRGMKPGQAQIEAEERLAAETEEAEAADPHFGRRSQ